MVALTHGCDFLVNAFEQHLFGIAPADAFGIRPSQTGGFADAGKSLVNLEQRRPFDVLGLARRARVGHDACYQLAQLLARREQGNGVVVALAHLAPVQAGQQGDRLFNHCFGQHEMLAIVMVEAQGHVARHFNVLDLVATDRHLVRPEHQDVGAHQHRIHEQASRDVGIRLVAGSIVFVD